MNPFYEELKELPREDLLDIIGHQDPHLLMGVERVEWVFANKLRHLNWDDGSPVEGRPYTNAELALLIDEPFEPKREMTQAGFDIDMQRQLHIAKDPVLWAKQYLKLKPRVYQVLMLRHPSRRKVLRAGRRLGKTWTMSVILLHYAFTHKHGRCLVVAPMKSHVQLIYEEVMKMAKESDVVLESIVRNVTSPQFEIEFSNGSTIRFFTSGIRSGGKADVARGQEAHIIVLDELDMMTGEDLEALLAMLQKTDDNQEKKQLIGASTPTGRRETFWKWCHAPHFQEFWYPSYSNPFFDKETEDELRTEYTEMVFRHEIEADWGEDTEGVYPRRFIDLAFSSGRFAAEAGTEPEEVRAMSWWDYEPQPRSGKSEYIIGVDWDKYGAGSNIVVLEMCADDDPDKRFAGRTRLCYRQEIPKSEYTLTIAVDRVIELNNIYQPKHIYVDRGNGEVQVELLHKYGAEHPNTLLRKRVKGIAFGGTIEVRNPATRQIDKKEIKPFMVDNLVQMLEREELCFSQVDYGGEHDLYHQLISYVVKHTTPAGRPTFEMAGTVPDHAHDALILACLAIAENYGELMKMRVARRSRSISNEVFLPLFTLSNNPEEREREAEIVSKTWGDEDQAPIERQRSMTVKMDRKRGGKKGPVRRKMF
jgi:hypothetical protein